MSSNAPVPSEPTEWQKQQWKEAERAHDRQDEAIKSHVGQVEAFSILGIRTLALTAAGGIAAALGFYSANYDHLSQVPGALQVINGILAVLFTSMLATLLSTLAAYLSQIYFAHSLYSRKRTYTHPYVENGDRTDRLTLFGNIWRTIAIVTAIFAAICLCVAGFAFLGVAT
ncbi:hypothetical protein [Devosia neptuniae]|uniref:hypothetical protein n=1 Tax=Devosia neptuniae TaxID=191302 RepID=UPI0022AF0A46|nr:hypothetical protein [Devosia neptuniae]MCZ4344491.1 hypothetical protein [Devosia neptuniae]